MNLDYKIAILGGTSHIAKNLILRFNARYELIIFCRNFIAMREFLEINIPIASYKILPYEKFVSGVYDVIINCIGIADPKKQKSDPYESFRVTEYFDSMAIDYVKSHPSVKYINLSSGAVFGTEFNEPISEESKAIFYPNKLCLGDCYRMAKLNSEAKHRCLTPLQIVDIRIFSFFSRYIDLEAGFFLSEVAKCLLLKRPFITNASDMTRDYISPDDLYALIVAIISRESGNVVLDAHSAQPVKKSELLKLLSSEFHLVVEYNNSEIFTLSGDKSEYFSITKTVESLLNIFPTQTSLEFIQSELKEIINNYP